MYGRNHHNIVKQLSSNLKSKIKYKKKNIGKKKEASFYAGDLGLIPESGRSLKKGMATHFSILAWRNPWTEEPGGLPPTGATKSRTRLTEHTDSMLFLTLSLKPIIVLELSSPTP